MHTNIHCDPSSEPSCRDGSDEGSQHMVSVRNKKSYFLIIIRYSLLSRALYNYSLVKPNCLIIVITVGIPAFGTFTIL